MELPSEELNIKAGLLNNELVKINATIYQLTCLLLDSHRGRAPSEARYIVDFGEGIVINSDTLTNRKGEINRYYDVLIGKDGLIYTLPEKYIKKI